MNIDESRWHIQYSGQNIEELTLGVFTAGNDLTHDKIMEIREEIETLSDALDAYEYLTN